MYHEITYEELAARRTQRIRMAAATAAVAALVWCGVGVAQRSAREQGVVAVRTAVINAALQCCAVEGSFPTSIEVLEQRYGLVINREDYHVSYEWLGDNIAPSVVVSIP